jgi:hypothetical protein
MMDEDLTGVVLPAADSTAWAAAMDKLLDDAANRQRMSRIGPTRMARFSPAHAFQVFWDTHAQAAAVALETEACDKTVQREAIAEVATT